MVNELIYREVLARYQKLQKEEINRHLTYAAEAIARIELSAPNIFQSELEHAIRGVSLATEGYEELKKFSIIDSSMSQQINGLEKKLKEVLSLREKEVMA